MFHKPCQYVIHSVKQASCMILTILNNLSNDLSCPIKVCSKKNLQNLSSEVMGSYNNSFKFLREYLFSKPQKKLSCSINYLLVILSCVFRNCSCDNITFSCTFIILNIYSYQRYPYNFDVQPFNFFSLLDSYVICPLPFLVQKCPGLRQCCHINFKYIESSYSFLFPYDSLLLP